MLERFFSGWFASPPTGSTDGAFAATRLVRTPRGSTRASHCAERCTPAPMYGGEGAQHRLLFLRGRKARPTRLPGPAISSAQLLYSPRLLRHGPKVGSAEVEHAACRMCDTFAQRRPVSCELRARCRLESERTHSFERAAGSGHSESPCWRGCGVHVPRSSLYAPRRGTQWRRINGAVPQPSLLHSGSVYVLEGVMYSVLGMTGSEIRSRLESAVLCVLRKQSERETRARCELVSVICARQFLPATSPLITAGCC